MKYETLDALVEERGDKEERKAWRDILSEVATLRGEKDNISQRMLDNPAPGELKVAERNLDRSLSMLPDGCGQCSIRLDLEAEVEKLTKERDLAATCFREAEGMRDYWKNREKKRTTALQAEVKRLEQARAFHYARWEQAIARAMRAEAELRRLTNDASWDVDVDAPTFHFTEDGKVVDGKPVSGTFHLTPVPSWDGWTYDTNTDTWIPPKEPNYGCDR